MKNLPDNTTFFRRLKWRTLAALLLALTITLVAATAWARYIPNRQAVENDLFFIGDSLVISENVQGNVFVVGRDFRLEGKVQGSLFVLADQAVLDGRVDGSIYAAALTLRQNANSQVGQSVYAVSVNLITERGAAIERDLRAIAVSANLRGAVNRDTQARIGLLELWRALQRGVTGGISSLPLPASVSISQPDRWSGYAIAGLPALVINQALVPSAPAVQPATETPSPWLENLKALLVLLLIGAAVLWLFPGVIARMEQQARLHPVASTGVGAVILVNGFLMPALITILVGGAFFGLIFLSVPDLAWMLFGVGFGVVVTAFSLFLLALAYLSKAIVATMIGGLILQRWLPRYAQIRFLPLLLGMLIYILLVSIPYLGITIGLLATMLGLGAMWLGRRPALPGAVAVVEVDQQPLPASEPAGVIA